jgi:outer membrane protein
LAVNYLTDEVHIGERNLRMKRILLYGIIALVSVFIFFLEAVAREYTLGEVYFEALKNSEKIKMAQENLYIAQIGKNKAFSVLAPKVTAFGTYNRYSEEKTTVSGTLIQPQESGNWGVRADQSFSASVRELNALKIAGQSITKNEYDLDATKADFILAVASAYYDVLKAKKTLEIAAANMARLSQYRDSVEKRVIVGELTKTALLRADGELSGARSDYLKATNAMKIVRAFFVRITGIEDNFRLKETSPPDEDDIAMVNLRDTAFASRADLKSYDMQTKIAAEQIKYARGAFWPNLNLFAIYLRADQSPAGQVLNRESVLAGVGLSFPFFEGGLRIAELNEAKAKNRQAKLVYDDYKKSVDIELQGAYLDLQTQKGILKFLEDQLIFAQDNYNAVIRQFNNGLATSLDVMDANSLLLSAEKNVAEALYNYQFAYLRLKKSSGMLLQYITINN